MTRIIILLLLVKIMMGCASVSNHKPPNLLSDQVGNAVPTITRIDETLSCLSQHLSNHPASKKILFVVDKTVDSHNDPYTNPAIRELVGRMDGHVLSAINRLRLPLSCSMAIGCDVAGLVKRYNLSHVVRLTPMVSGYDWTTKNDAISGGFNLLNYLIGTSGKDSTFDLLRMELIATNGLGATIDVQSFSTLYQDQTVRASLQTLGNVTTSMAIERKQIASRSQGQREMIQLSTYAFLSAYFGVDKNASRICLNKTSFSKQQKNRWKQFYSKLNKWEQNRQAQIMLSWAGFYKGDCDALWGPRSKKAAVLWKTAMNLRPTDKQDMNLYISLRERMPKGFDQSRKQYCKRS